MLAPVPAVNCNRTYLATGSGMGSDFQSLIADFKDMPMGSLQVVWENANSTAGYFKLYASNFPEPDTFDDIDCSDLTITTAAGSKLWAYERLCFRYMQVRWVAGSTTAGTCSIIALGKKS